MGTYFNNFLNTWYHGDYAEIKKGGGFIIHGRSDTTLNPGGVRLGTAEIYSEVEKFVEIKESIVVGQAWDNDVRIILFIVLNPKHVLNENLLKKIRTQIRKNASPRHVPSKIIVVDDIPRTKNGKIVELAVKNTIEGNEIKNKEGILPNDFKKLNCEVIGISKDSIESHKKFISKYKIPFQLLSDEKIITLKKYGVWGDGTRGSQEVGSVHDCLGLAGYQSPCPGQAGVARKLFE